MNAYAAYRKNSIENASREDILLMLFEGALVRVKRAMKEWSEGNHARAKELRAQAMAIVLELDNTLDRLNGEASLVEELDSLYGYMIREFNACIRKNDFNSLQGIQIVLEKLYEGFQIAVPDYKKLLKEGAITKNHNIISEQRAE